MKLTVTAKELRYAGKNYAAGDDIETTEKEGRALKLLRKAQDAKPKPHKPTQHYSETPAPPVEVVAEVAAEPQTFEPVAVEDEPPANRYRTRRIKADD